ncbi:hypothetical protein [Sphaerimonospora thailandensis]|nr:hypothetical protein [Sphaerimonospora thailandensis]
MFAKVIAGLALGTALAGGIVALGATAAGASTGPDNNRLINNNNDYMHNNHWFSPQNNWWNQLGRADNRNGREALGMAVKDVVLGFQQKDNRDDKQFLNNWWNNRAMFGGNNAFGNNRNINEHPLQRNRGVNQPVLVQPVQRERVIQPVQRERVIQPVAVQPTQQRVIQPTLPFNRFPRFGEGLGGF